MRLFISKAGNIFYKEKPLTEGEEHMVLIGLLVEVEPNHFGPVMRTDAIELKGDQNETLH